jgi:CubicO group peptidase (beta-lactamase class C family)
VSTAAVLVLFFVVVASAFGATSTRVSTPLLADLDGRFGLSIGSLPGQTPGCSIAVVEDGKIVLERGYGFESLSSHKPVTPQTRFRVGSITKMFTALSIMQLVERGAVSLEAPLARYLPDAPHAAEITVRQLLNHTSGLANYSDTMFTNSNVTEAVTPLAILATIARKPLVEKPGDRFEYSNTNYVLLGLIVERITRMPLGGYEREHILRPAGMDDTGFADDSKTAVGYAASDGAAAVTYDPSWFYGDGNVVSTAGDLARFDVALLAGKIVRAATFRAMEGTIVPSNIGPGISYGLGFMISQFGGKAFVGHHGGVPGFSADDQIIPRDRFALVVLSNAGNFVTGRITQDVLRVFYPANSWTAGESGTAQQRGDKGTVDPVLQQRFADFVRGLDAHEIDRSWLTPAMQQALDPKNFDQLCAVVSALGNFQSLEYVSQTKSGDLTSYSFSGHFAQRTMPLTFSVTSDGHLAGFHFQ